MARYSGILALVAALTSAPAGADERLPAPLADTHWTLASLDGRAPSTAITLELSASGAVTGRAPCNTYGATLLEFDPEFRLGPIRATRRACPALREESAYLALLGAARQATVTEDGLVLAAPDGRALVFSLVPPAD